MITPLRGKARRIECSLLKLEDPDVLAAGTVCLRLWNQGGVHGRHGREIREVAALVNGVRHRAAEKIYVVSKDHHEVAIGRIGGGANLRESFFAIPGDPLRLTGSEAVGGEVGVARRVRLLDGSCRVGR